MKIERGGIINDFIQPNRKQYAIPVYQRNYEWSREQCIRLFEDIIAAHKNDRDHFTGSIVYAPLKTENKIDTFIIIDGQQRLTTIYILIKALIDMAESERDRNALESVVFNEDKFRQYQIDESSKLKLKPVKSDNRQLMLLMENRIDEIDKSSGIYRNYTLFRELIGKTMYTDDQLGVAHIFDGIEHLTCATIKLDPDDSAQEIFERINSTGIPLSLADKIRNFVLMTDIDQERLYEDYWLAIENLVGYNWLTAFFMDYLNIKVDYFPREDQAYETFKLVFKKNACTNKSMLEEILYYAKFYHAFLYGDPQYSVSVNDTLAALRRLNQTTVYLFLFRVFDDYHNKVIDQTVLEKVLSFLLNYSIRRMMCEVPSNSLRGMYKTLHNRIFNCAENKAHYYDAIVSFFRQVSSRDAWIDDRTFSDALIHNNLYRKNALCKYLLTAIENDGKEQIVTDNLTIEHVIPQNKKLSSEWQKMLGENWENDRERYLHTLGNLTLTGYNSELGDRPFAEKKKHFSDVNSKTVALNRSICQCDNWNAETIETRATELALFILKHFPDEVPETVISFADPRYQLYSCDDPENATYKVPNFYELRGERVNVTSFAEMLRSVIERLYAMDSSIIEHMARTNEGLENWPQNIMFSYDKNRVNGSLQIKGTDIYENTNFSARYVIFIIRALLDKYGIDREDFTYSARKNR